METWAGFIFYMTAEPCGQTFQLLCANHMQFESSAEIGLQKLHQIVRSLLFSPDTSDSRSRESVIVL